MPFTASQAEFQGHTTLMYYKNNSLKLMPVTEVPSQRRHLPTKIS